MEFDNSFTVNAPIQRVWKFLLDIQQVAPCMPGAQLTEVVNDREYKGIVKIKLGAVQMSYGGTATITEIDEAARRIVLSASGKETRGTGGASTTSTSTLVEDGPNRTSVQIHSEVNVTGRVAQFGRGIMQDVASRLIGEFAKNIEARLTTSEEPSAPGGDAAPSPSGGSTSTETTVGDSAASTSGQESVPQAAPRQYTPAASPPVAEPTPIKILPILVDVTRSQIARGLHKLASLVEPSRT